MGDLLPDPITGELMTQAERHRMLVDGAVAAEEAGSGSSTDGETGQDTGSDEDTDASDEEEELMMKAVKHKELYL